MYELTLHQTDLVIKYVTGHEIVFSHLRDDLTDHICCDIEDAMKKGAGFDEAFNAIKLNLGSNRLIDIQKETLFAVDKKYRKMKRIMKISGVAGTVLLGLSTVLKIQHWPFGGMMMLLGALILILFFLPSSLMVLWKETKSGKRIFIFITAFLSSVAFMAGVLFKVQHWPAAGLLLSIGILSAVFLFIPAITYRIVSGSENRLPVWLPVTGATAIAVYGIGYLLKIMHMPGAGSLLTIGLVLLAIVFVPAYFFNRWRKDEKVSLEAVVIILIGMFFIVPSALMALNTSLNFNTMFRESFDMNNRNIDFRNARNGRLLIAARESGAEKTLFVDSLAREVTDQIEIIENSIIPSFDKYRSNIALAYGGDLSQLIDYNRTRPLYAPENKLIPELKARLKLFREEVNMLPESQARQEAVSLLEPGIYLPEDIFIIEGSIYLAPIAALQSLETLRGAVLDAEALVLREIPQTITSK